jgi:2-polyprenyl-3-methyl-5-hydroxy-6-metoxy-1,4-benzoquinol methylase
MMWDERYDTDEYVYGTKPNDFLLSVAGRLPRGRILCLAEGEGRNAVYLAELGFEVHAVDGSAVGLEKADRLAKERGVTVETEVADLGAFDLGVEKWDGIISIFCHLPSVLRQSLHKRVVKALKPKGVFVLEAYTPEQLSYKTGGPPHLDMLMSLDDLKRELTGLKFECLVEIVRDVQEGRLHSGKAAVIQAVGFK